MDKNTILKAVIDYNNVKPYPVRFHMPGHKGRSVGLPFDDAFAYDLTEIPSTGNLLDPDDGDVTDTTLEYITGVCGTHNTVISAGGATLALQTAILCAVRKSRRKIVYCYRHIHRSAVYAMAMCGVDVRWLADGEYPDSKAAAMLVTSPDYYGRTLDICTIADKCAKYSIPLIVDCAHGPHLIYHDGGRLHPTRNGAALTVDSLHKTLPALTGCALLHSMPYAGGVFSRDDMLSAMRTFASTSPSYLLQCSTVRCVEFMEENGSALLGELYTKLTDTKRKIRMLGFDVPDRGDPFRLVICDGNAPELEKLLADDNIIAEFSDADNLVLIPSVMTDDTDLGRLVTSLENAVKRGFVPTAPTIDNACVIPGIPGRIFSLRKAVMSDSTVVPTDKAVLQICAEPVTPYPPGVPVVMPGEVITEEAAQFILSHGIDTVRVVK